MNNRSGDIDNDGLPISVADLVYFESNLSTISNNPNLQVQDLNRDNIVDASDVEYLANHILGVPGYELPTSGLYFQNKDNGKIAIGYSNSITGTNSIIIGNNSSADYNDSIAIGNNITIDNTNQIVIGDAISTSIFNGNVGIGTTTPTPGKKLHVIGDVRIEGSLTTNGETTIINTNVDNTERLTITNDGTGPAIIVNQKGSQPIADFQDDGTSVFYIEDGGNVGIGIIAPAHALDVSGNIRIKGENLYIGNDANDSLRFNHHKNPGGTESFSYIDYNDDGNLYFRSTSTSSYPTTMTLSGNGNVGIGIGNLTNPDNILHVRGNGPQLLLEGQTNEDAILRFSSGPSYGDKYNEIVNEFYASAGNGHLNKMHFKVNEGGESNSPGTRMTIRGDGNVGIGTDDPKGKLHIYETTGTGTATTGTLVLEHGNSGGFSSIIFPSAVNQGSDYGYISYQDTDTIGGVGETARLTIGTSNDGNDNIVLAPSGVVTSTKEISAPSFNATSDIRLKKDIEPLNLCLDQICQLQGVKFTRIDDKKKNRQIGFIAQEVEQIIPELVSTDLSVEKYKSIAYGNVTALLVEAIKELRQQVNELREEIKNNK